MSSSLPGRRSSVRYPYLALLLVISLFAAILPLPARFDSVIPRAEAATTDLFFSEYIEGTGNDKALEIYNGTGVAINLAALGYKVEFYSNGSATTTTSNTFNLVGTIPNNGTFVLAPTNANTTILAAANQQAGTAWFNGNDAVVLKKGTVIVDSIGQVGNNPGTEWGTGLTSTADNTLRRKSAICAGDTNATDVFDPATEWDGLATNTFNGLGSHTATCGTTPPSGVGSASPNSLKAGGQTTLTINVTPGGNPSSTGINLTADLSSIGGSATQQFNNNSGNVFSFNATVSDSTLPGVKTLPVTITDNQARVGSASIKLNIQPDSLDHLVISQVYGGGGNNGATLKNDFIELYNPTVNPISLSGWTVQYASSGGSTWSRTDLAGTLAPGEYYLIQEANGAGGTIDLTSPNAIGGIAMSATDGKVALVSNSDLLTGTCPDTPDVVDFVGYGSANCFEGLASTPSLTNTTAALRNDSGKSDTDNNVADFDTAGSPNPRFSSGGNNGGGEVAPSVSSTSPAKNSTNVLIDASITVNFSEPVTVPPNVAWYTINCANSGLHDATVTGGPTSFKLDPASDFAYSEQCTVTISGNLVADGDINDPPDNMTADYSWTFTTVGSSGIVRDPNEHLVMGIPSAATADIANENDYLMKKPEYALSYNRSRAIPNWTSWHLDSSWRGSQARTNTFRADPDLPAGWYHVNEFSYSGSGFDRGHMTPSADRTFNFQENAATFLMTNMIPQAPNNNQVTWEGLESYARSLLTAGNEVYIISGGYGQGGTGSNGGVTQTIDQGRIVVPAKTWKVLMVLPNADGNDVARVTTSTRTIAVIMPNAQGINADWRNFIVSVDDVEALTGLDFFSNVPEAIQSVIEANRDGNTRPVANAQSVTVQEDGTRSITLTGTDADSNPLTYTIASGPSHGSLVGGGTDYTYTPEANYHGPDSFTFTVKDAYVPSEPATVEINVTAINDAPVANSQSVTTSEDASVDITLSGSDVETLTSGLSFVVVSNPANGTLSGTGANLTYTPNANFNGNDSFTFKVTDTGDGDSAALSSSEATVSIAVNPVNDAPVANAGTDQTLECAGITGVTLNGSASDVDGDTPLTYEWREGTNQLGTGSTLGVQLSSGLHTITLKVTDPSGDFGEDTVNVNIVDTTAPTIMLSGPAISLWPPNKKYRNFNVSDLVQSATDSCDSGVNLNSVVIQQVTSDEGTLSNNDIIIGGDCKSVQLRADRNGSGNGRVYTITFSVRDSSGNRKTLTRQVIVPHDQGNGAIDSGVAYTVMSSCQ